ncbi:MAG: hypothetical protein ACE5GA_11775, partial [Candidatus Zixiibacteriota bacterium]
MNAGHLIGFFWLGLVVVLYTLLIWRNVFINERFRFLVTVSGSALTLGAALNWLRAFENYPRWFLPNVYPALEWVFVALIAVGVITLFLGLISEFGSFRRGRETAAVSRASPEPPRQPRSAVRSSSFVSACAALRRELERPLAVIELGTVALHRLLSGLSLRSGALYVLNEAGSQLALVAADGLAPEDQALFERLRADDALVVKSLDESIPAISAVEDWTGLSAEARSSIVLTLPLISQGESLGLALLFSEQTLALSGAEREEISEMGRMIAEKLLLARLRGQLSRQSATATRNESDHRAWSERTDRALAALDQPEGCRALCDAFVGIGGAERAGFFAQESDFDSLALVGASDGFPALSDGFRRAIGQGIVRATPALLNQSGANRVGSTGGRRTRRTVGLVYPLRAVAGDTRRYALILLRQDGEFALTQREFSHLQSLISVAQAVLGARVRRGRLERQRDVLRGAHQLLSAVPTGAGSRQTTADFFATITSLLPVSAVALLY